GALKAFFSYRSDNANDTEILALSYWGLSLLESAPIENMVYHLKDSSFTDLAKLYLAEAFLAADDKENALYLYNTLAKDLKMTEQGIFFSRDDEQNSIFKALVMLDLSIKLETAHTDGLLDYLMSVEMTTQTNRYLMCLSLLNYVSFDSVVLSDGTFSDDQSLLSVEPWLPGTEETIKGEFRQNDKKADAVEEGTIFSLTADWGNMAKDNSLYMLYFTDSDMTFLAEDNLVYDHGHTVYLTMDTKADLNILAEAGREIGDAYLFDLTAGKIMAKVDLDDLVVVE
ncbi:MAG: hypothetical protein Q4C00_03305, partial [Bacillota bacterium]|nr:hypothetical protein [Bacillota bacterium]